MAENVVQSNKEYLDSKADAILMANSEGISGLSIQTNSYESTTNIPSKEPTLVEQLLESSKQLFEKLDKEMSCIKEVGEEIKDMDNYLKDVSLDLGFKVTSEKMDPVELKEYEEIDLSELLSLQVPVVQQPTTTTGGTTYPTTTGTPSTTTTTPTTTTPTTTTPTTETPSTETPTKEDDKKEDKPYEGEMEPDKEDDSKYDRMSNEPIDEGPTVEEITKYNPEKVTEVTPSEDTKQTEAKPVEQKEEPLKESHPVSKSTSSGGGSSSKKKVTKFVSGEDTSKKEETKTEEPKVEEPSVPEENLVQEEPINQEVPYIIEPSQEEQNITPEEPITKIDEPAPQTKKSNAGAIAGAIAGVAAVAGAGAAGYMVYKKKQEDEEFKDYTYDDGSDE